jgi:hypothetical protein
MAVFSSYSLLNVSLLCFGAKVKKVMLPPIGLGIGYSTTAVKSIVAKTKDRNISKGSPSG